MKKLFLIIAALGSITFAKAQISVKIEKGMATLDGKQWLAVQETKIDKTTNYEVVKTLSGVLIAQLTFTENSDKVYFKGEFPSIAKKYEINYPSGTTIHTVLESYNNNKVIVNNNIDLTGLQKYCDERKIPLNKILTPEEQKEKEANQQTVYSYTAEKKKINEQNYIKDCASGANKFEYDGTYLENSIGSRVLEMDGNYVKNSMGLRLYEKDGNYIISCANGSRLLEFSGNYIINCSTGGNKYEFEGNYIKECSSGRRMYEIFGEIPLIIVFAAILENY